jgi:hypothetical protein
MTKQDKGFREKVQAEIRNVILNGIDSYEATDRIVSLVRELVPNEQADPSDPLGGMNPTESEDAAAVYGFNKCRTEILSRLEEGK